MKRETCLHHELFDHSMKDTSIVIGLFRMLNEVLARFRNEFRKETKINVSHRRMENGRL